MDIKKDTIIYKNKEYKKERLICSYCKKQFKHPDSIYKHKKNHCYGKEIYIKYIKLERENIIRIQRTKILIQLLIEYDAEFEEIFKSGEINI